MYYNVHVYTCRYIVFTIHHLCTMAKLVNTHTHTHTCIDYSNICLLLLLYVIVYYCMYTVCHCICYMYRGGKGEYIPWLMSTDNIQLALFHTCTSGVHSSLVLVLWSITHVAKYSLMHRTCPYILGR